MQRNRVLETVILASIILFIVFMYQAGGTPTDDTRVESSITCTFVNGAQLSVHAQMLVNKITVFDTPYNRQQIEQIAPSDPYTMGAIMLRLHESLKSQITQAFPGTQPTSLIAKPGYSAPYFTDDFRVNLTPEFFDTSVMNLSNVVNGVLDMGAVVTYHFPLSSEEGWNTSYVYLLPESLVLDFANTRLVNSENSRVEWQVENWAGETAPVSATLSVRAKNPTMSTVDTQDISLTFTLDTRTIRDIHLAETVTARMIDVHNYATIPSFITGLISIPADGVRLFIDNGLLSWSDVFTQAIQPIVEQTTPILENSSFNQTLSLTFSWNRNSTTNCSTPYNITHMDCSPPVQATYEDPNVQLQICGMPARAFFGVINAGATASVTARDVTFGQGLDRIPWPCTFILRFPENVTLDGKNTYSWNTTTPFTGVFSSDVQPTPSYAGEQVSTVIEIELSKMDLNIPSIFTGKTELVASTKIKENDALSVIDWPAECPLESPINISYMNADAFRLCAEEQVFNGADINQFLAQRKTMFEQQASSIMPGLTVRGATDRKAFYDSLAWDGDISAMDSVVPVLISNAANQVYNIKFNVSLWPMTMSISPQRFSLPGLENQSVTYRIIFPKGITVNATDALGNMVNTGVTTDGRDYVELSLDTQSRATVLTCVLNASPVYVLGIFLPIMLVFSLLVILIVIIYLIRKRRSGGGRRRGKTKMKTMEPLDVEPEDDMPDYYVPPPPPTKRRR